MSEKEPAPTIKETEGESDEHKNDLEWQKLQLDKQRLNLDVDSHESSKRLESERISLEKSKERTSKLQLALPLAVSVMALLFNSVSEYQRSRQAAENQYYQFKMQEALTRNKEARLELFRRLTEHINDEKELKRIYKEVFHDNEQEDFLQDLTHVPSPTLTPNSK